MVIFWMIIVILFMGILWNKDHLPFSQIQDALGGTFIIWL